MVQKKIEKKKEQMQIKDNQRVAPESNGNFHAEIKRLKDRIDSINLEMVYIVEQNRTCKEQISKLNTVVFSKKWWELW